MTAPGLIQVCSRCGAYWPVALTDRGPVAARWCPTCNGDLYAPSPVPGAPVVVASPVTAPTPHPISDPVPPTPAPAAADPIPQVEAPQVEAPQVPAPPPPAAVRRQTDDRRTRLPRGYRWRAVSPDHEADPPPTAPPEPGTPTPRYTETPQWGLPIGGNKEGAEPGRIARLAALTPDALRLLTVALVAVVAAEGFRYLLMLLNQGRALPAVVVWISDALVVTAGAVAIITQITTIVVAAAWLIDARTAAFARRGQTDPRRAPMMMAGCLIPVINLVVPGTLVAELAALSRAGRAGPLSPPTAAERRMFPPPGRGFGTAALVRWWWLVWVWTNLVALGAILMRFDTSAQGRADGVLATIAAALAGLVAVAVTAALLRRLSGSGPAGPPRRWVLDTATSATGPPAASVTAAVGAPATESAEAGAGGP